MGPDTLPSVEGPRFKIPTMSKGYYIQDNPDGPNSERIRAFGIIKMHHLPLLDGPIESYINNPNYIVTEFDVVERVKNLKTFEIWMEGYAATGESGTAQKIGEGEGETFDEAVRDYMLKNPKHGIEWNDSRRYSTDEAYMNRRSHWNIWACNLYDNEADARKAFG